MGFSFKDVVARDPTVKTDRDSGKRIGNHDFLYFFTWN